MIKERSTCRICDGELKLILDFGEIYPSNFVQGDEVLEKAPLALSKCQNCNLVQLKHTVELDSMYRQYWYRSGLNPSMVRDLQDIVTYIEGIIELNDGDVVVDIGCNDGTMLTMYKNNNLYKVGFDPALNLKESAEKNCDLFVNDYFPNNVEFPKAKVITTIAMFYDLEDPKAFVSSIKDSLATDGIWVIQFTDLLSMFEINAFDNICHEHLEYYSLRDISTLVGKYGLEIIDVTGNKVNGGSIRIVVAHKGQRERNFRSVYAMGYEQGYLGAYKGNHMEVFSDRISEIKNTLVESLKILKDDGKTIAVLGASTKGNTLLQYFGIDNTLIDHAAEVNKDKVGLKTVGTNIPIISQEESFEKNPDYYLVLPWHFIEDFVDRYSEYILNGGKLIVPLPTPKVFLEKDGRVLWGNMILVENPQDS